MHARAKLAFFGAAIAVCALAACAKSAPREWPSINVGDFRYLRESDGVRYYVKRQPATGHPRLLLRMEYLKPTMAEGIQTASAVILTEFDCDKGLSNDVMMAGYPRNNMQGEEKSARAQSPYWEPVSNDGSLRELFEIACGKPAP